MRVITWAEAGAEDRLPAGAERLGGRGAGPGPDVRTDDELLDYIHKTHNTVYHPSCTVKMGADGDFPSAPLDARLRVKGVEGLRGRGRFSR